MELKSLENKGCDYHLIFEEKSESSVTSIDISFQQEWKFIPGYESTEESWPAIVSQVGKIVAYPYEMKMNLLTVPIHIPHPYGRHVFKACLDYFAKQTYAPVHTTTVEHPGYPLLTVTFDQSIIYSEDMTKIIESIFKGIHMARVETRILEEADEPVEDPLDDIDESTIIEFDLEEDIKAFLHQPADREILPFIKEGNDLD